MHTSSIALAVTLGAFALAVVTAQFTTSTTLAQTPAACANFYGPAVAIPANYGASYDLTGGGQMEVTATCNKITPTFDVGRNVSTDYVYKLGYLYQSNAWQPLNLTSSSALQSNSWYTGKASGPIPSSAITSTWSYAVGYVCAWNGLSWKCGCADTACTTGKWQLQAYERAAQTSTTTTSNTTTGNTTSTSECPSGTTITPGSGSSTDSTGAVWTVTSAGKVAKNGVVDAVTNGVILGLYYNHSFYQENNGNMWYRWTGSSWVQVSGDPRSTTTTTTTSNTTGNTTSNTGVCQLGNHGAVRGRARIANGTLVAEDGCLIRAVTGRTEEGGAANALAYWQTAHNTGHFNAIRAMAFIGDWYDSGQNVNTIDMLEGYLDQMLANASQTGMYLIIDNHSGKYTMDLNRDTNFWNAIAERYKHHTNVIYELKNEPDMGMPPENVLAYTASLYQTVRSHDPDTMIIAFSPVGIAHADWVSMAQQAGIDYSKAVFGFHPYDGTTETIMRDTVNGLKAAGIASILTEMDSTEWQDTWKALINSLGLAFCQLSSDPGMSLDSSGRPFTIDWPIDKKGPSRSR